MFIHLTRCKTIGVFLLTGVMSFCGKAIADPVLSKILSSHSITLAWVDNTPPIAWQLNGKPSGMAIDICLNVVDNIKKQYKTNINVKWLKVVTAARFEVIAHNQADILCAIAANTEQRTKLVNFSTPWFYTQLNYMAKKSNNITNESMLAGHTVGVLSGGTSALFLAKLNPSYNYSISVKLVRDFNEGFTLLEKGHISAFVTDDIIIRSKLATLPDKDKYQTSPVGFGEELSYGLVVAKDADKMKKIIDEEIKSMFTSGRFDTLYNKWFMSPFMPSGAIVQQPMPERLIEEKKCLMSATTDSTQP